MNSQISFREICLLEIEAVNTCELENEVSWLSEMTEDEYNELSRDDKNEVDRIRLKLTRDRLNRLSPFYILYIFLASAPDIPCRASKAKISRWRLLCCGTKNL